jgi:hypothetical protein
MLILICYSIAILVAMVVAGSLYVNGAVNGQKGRVSSLFLGVKNGK